MTKGRPSDCPFVPEIVTNSGAFYLDPDSALPEGPRPALAHSEYGYEFLSFPVVRQAFRDKRMKPRDLAYFKSIGASDLILEFIREGNLNFMAPDKHDKIRAIMVKAFTPSRIESFRLRMREIADEMIDQFAASGRANLVADFAHAYPISVIVQFVGIQAEAVASISEATVHLRMLGQKPFAPGMPILEKALSFLHEYIGKLVAERRAGPAQDDFLGALIALHESEEDFTEEELVWGVAFLMLGGHDTTRYTLAGCFVSILEAGLWEDLARDPELIPQVITESMRYHPGTPRQMRIVAEPLEVEGVALEPGDVVSLNLSAAGRDPEIFEDPGAFRCPRADQAYDIGFGFGRHVCVGQSLARTEMAEAIGRLTQRLTEVEPDGEFRLKPTGVVAGYDSVPVRFRLRDG